MGVNNETDSNELKGGINDSKKKKLFNLVVVILLIWSMMTAAGAYLLRDITATQNEKTQSADILALKSEIDKLKQQLETELSENSSANSGQSQSDVCVEVLPSESAIENIKASITSGNTAALEGYMVNDINVILAASEGLGVVTPAEAVAAVTDFIGDNSNVWSFDISDQDLNLYVSGDYGQYFSQLSVVGKSNDNKIISFMFCNSKIDTVFLSNSTDILVN